MTPEADARACREAIRTGSHSFHAASRLLPPGVRDPALALYAFCRLADDAVDEVRDKGAAVDRLRARLARVYAGRPLDAAADRAFARVVERHAMPRALPEALIDGFAWDAAGRRYRTLGELRAYAARVASAVGAMMCVVMGVRDRDALARACDLGVAMQLTNIARDVGEDARAGRLYLPEDWLDAAGVDAAAFLRAPAPSAGLALVVRRLLGEARRLYDRSEAGVAMLPPLARPGILAARRCYDGIGGAVARAGHDSVSRRAVTTGAQKALWLGRAVGQAVWVTAMPRSAVLLAPPLRECLFLVDAAADPRPVRAGRGEGVLATLGALAAHDRAAMGRGLAS